MSKEFWFHALEDDTYFETFVSTTDPKKLSDDEDYMYLKTSNSLVHVIKYSAYEKIKQDLDIANNYIKGLENQWEEHVGPTAQQLHKKLKVACGALEHLHKNAVFMDVEEGSNFVGKTLLELKEK